MPVPRSFFPAAGSGLMSFVWPRALAWTVLLVIVGVAGGTVVNLEQRRVALRQIRASYLKDLAYRNWVAERGGVYVPLDGRTEPNPFLAHLPERDVVTTGGKRLTLVNPAYLTRMIHEDGKETLGLRAKITGDHPFRAGNAPDPWEARALDRVRATGAEEVSEVQTVGGQTYLRFLGALKVQEGCLNCHREQGFKVGEVRGGLSLSMPMEPLFHLGRFPGLMAMVVELLGLWAVGLAALVAWGHHWVSLARLKATSEADRIGAEQYRAILQTTVDGFLHLDASGRILDVNEGYLRLSGFTREELLRMRLQQLEEDPREADTAEFNRVNLLVQGERRVTRHRAKDGRVWIVELSLTPMEGGRTWVAMLRDMTREYQARQALEESEQRLLNAQRIAHIGFWERELESDQLICSRETFRILGLEPRPDGVLRAREMYELIHPEDRSRMDGLFQKVATGTPPFRGEVRIIRPDGSLRYLDTHAEIFLGRGGRGLRIIRTLFDITERREAEAEKRQLELEVQHAQKLESLGSLAGGVAHDMNNVLGAIFMVASGLQEQRAEDAALMKSLDLVMNAAGRGRDLVRSLTEFARKGVEEPTRVDLNQLVKRELELLRRTTLQKLELVEEVAPDLPGVLGDPSSLANALMNLCVNAMDAMPEGGRLRLATRLLEDGRVELRVEDTGIGMAPEVLQRATEPFFTTKAQGKGTGLGLAMVYGIVKAHGGTLDIQSRQGVGTTITLRFPGMAGTRAESPAVPESPGPFRPLRVLLVDDDDLIRSTVPTMLQFLGHAVEGVDSGLAAIHRMERGKPIDVVILDLNMPGLSGLETLARIRLLEPDLPVIISSGYMDGEAEALMAADPAVSFMAKPYTLADLRKRLGRLRLKPPQGRE
ncbi:MAG TPA: PAS domain S-box protein [Holophagaceae bacterium]|nr:PAS domain S-box protein [Holophagaceae bacterium]